MCTGMLVGALASNSRIAAAGTARRLCKAMPTRSKASSDLRRVETSARKEFDLEALAVDRVDAKRTRLWVIGSHAMGHAKPEDREFKLKRLGLKRERNRLVEGKRLAQFEGCGERGRIERRLGRGKITLVVSLVGWEDRQVITPKEGIGCAVQSTSASGMTFQGRNTREADQVLNNPARVAHIAKESQALRKVAPRFNRVVRAKREVISASVARQLHRTRERLSRRRRKC